MTRVESRASGQAETDTRLAAAIKELLARNERATACERFGEIVTRYQRRASRIAYYYLRDPADVDEAVQDAFLKAFTHLPSFREDLLFELWFTRIVINGCLDRLKARARRSRWLLPAGGESDLVEQHAPYEPSPEDALLARERRTRIIEAIDQLPERQRAVVVLTQLEDCSTREVSLILGLSEATVRVHLFRAIRGLRKLLRVEDWRAAEPPREQGASRGSQA